MRFYSLTIATIALVVLVAARAEGQPGQAGLQPPVLQQFVEADYPPEAKEKKLEGVVILQLEISAEGKVTRVTVVNPAGHGFDEAAVEAAKKFVFQPALRDGKPIASKIPFKYTFSWKPTEGPGDKQGDKPVEQKAKRAILRGEVQIGNSREPLQGARVRVTPTGGGAGVELTTNTNGTWELSELAPGKYRVEVEAPGYQSLEVVEEVETGQATEVIYRLQAANQGFEVVIKGERPPREVTKRTIEQRELSRIPGTNGDALRALQNLPGVARPPGLAGLLIVRGSAPQDTQIFVGGTLVPLVYHFGGLSSVIPTEMIERLDFYPGNFSAQYGRVTGGIVDVGIRSPKSDGKYHGLIQADFIDARVMAEGPVPFLKNWMFIGGARRSYVDVWLKPALEAAGAGVTTAPVYYDYQLFLETRPTNNSQVRIGLYGSDDRLEILIKNPAAQDPTLGGDLGLRTGFWRLQAEYKHQLTDRLRLNSVLAYGYNTINFNVGALYFKLDTHPVTNRLEFSYKPDKRVTLNVGQDILYNPYDIDLRAPQPPRPGEPDSGPFVTRPPRVVKESGSLYQPAAFAEAEILPTEGGRLVPGVRLDYNKVNQSWDFSPRFNARQIVRPQFPKTTLKGGIGVFQQPPQPQETNPVFGTPGIRSSRSIHYTFGTEQQITRQVDLSVEGFYKQLDNLVSRSPNINGTGFTYSNQGSGYVVGGEFLLRYRPDARFFGWLAYTLSRSTRRARPGEPLNLFQYDQTHILTTLGSYRLGRGWEFGARFRVVSGPLDTPCVGGIYSGAAGSYACISGAPFSERLPTFHQLDLRVDKRWDFQTWKLSLYLDILNVYNRGNVESLDYNYNFTKRIYQTGLPIIPSLGIRGEM
ncbi:MAG: TonB family protein [Myxococcales bacterium]|nr:TonB family protein [Polyangiaceae bacterium]MDW8249962.1 TonB family protein [Myxococcales bacterium]